MQKVVVKFKFFILFFN